MNRKGGITAIDGQCLIAILLIVQMWLLTATLEFSRDTMKRLPGGADLRSYFCGMRRSVRLHTRIDVTVKQYGNPGDP